MAASVDIILNGIDELTAPAKKAGKAVDTVVASTKKIGDATKDNERKASGVNSELTRTQRIMGGINKATSNFGNNLSSIITTLGSGALLAGITTAAWEWVELMNAQARAESQVRSGLESTGGVVGRTFEQLKDQATEIQLLTHSLIGDETINEVQAILLTFTKIRTEIYDKAIPAIADMATRLGVDLKTQAIQVGKALNDPLLGITSLRRVGVQFSEEQTQKITELVAAQKLEEAQLILLTGLQEKFGGSAQAAGMAGAYGWRDFVGQLGDAKEELGAAIIPLINSIGIALRDFLVPIITQVGKWLQENPRVVKIMAVALGVLSGAVAVATAAIVVMNAALWANPIIWIIGAVVALGAAVAAVVLYWDEIKLAVTSATLWIMEKVESLGSWLFGWIGRIAAFLWQYSPFNIILELIDNIFPGFKDKLNSILKWFYDKFIQPIIDAWNWIKEKLGFGKETLEAKIEAKATLETRERETAKTGYAAGTPFTQDENTPAPAAGTPSAVAAEGNVSGGGGMKMININIQRLIGVESLNTLAGEDTPEQVAERLKAALLLVLNDANNM